MSSKSPHKGCFAGSESVTLSNGDIRLISDISVGDVVLAANADGKPVISEVIAVPHGRNEEIAEFRMITLSSGRDVKLTPDHLILTGVCGSALSLQPAKNVETDMCVRTIDGDEVVVSSLLTYDKGIYTIVTKESYIVVNGVVASPFAGNHAVANAFYNIHRVLYTMFPSLMKTEFVRRTVEKFGKISVGGVETACRSRKM